MFSKYLLPSILEAFDRVGGEFDTYRGGPACVLHYPHISYYMGCIDDSIRAPTQRLEFVAKRLHSEGHALLGTPLFVALAE